MSYLGRFISETSGRVNLRKLFDHFYANGINILEDIRFKDVIRTLNAGEDGTASPETSTLFDRPIMTFQDEVSPGVVDHIAERNTCFRKFLVDERFVIPNFGQFRSEIEEIYEECKEFTSGEITTYIPSLSMYHHDSWAVSFCSIDGQVFNVGDYTDMFTIQSVTKPILYGIVSDDLGQEKVHQSIGMEPSGFGFNKITLAYPYEVPHNPLINTGAITAASLVAPNMDPSERFNYCFSRYGRLAKGAMSPVSFNNTVYLSEKHMGHRNYAILHYLVNKGCIDKSLSSANLTEIIDLYFQLCSVEMNTETLAVVGGTLANGGRNIFTHDQVFTADTVRNMCSLMLMCGMYNYSGRWAFEVGLPAKSGVSGAILVVIPKLGALAMWAPLLDTYGNSVKGTKFTRIIQERSNTITHMFRNLDAERIQKENVL